MKIILDTLIFLCQLIVFFFNLIFDIFEFVFSFLVLKKKNKIFYVKGKNTEYEIECCECGYTNKYMIGVSHTFGEDRVFYTNDLGYCPKCREPIYRSSHPKKKRGYICQNCGSETKEYKIGSRVKLRCPHCFSNKLNVKDLEQRWIT